MNILITICARGGSKGIPGKNIRLINGKPLLLYSIETANQIGTKFGAKIALSTDSSEIKNVAKIAGLHTDYDRPDFLSTDTAGKKGTIKHLVEYEEQLKGVRYDYVLDLDVTSPLRTSIDLELAFDLFRNDENAQTLFSVNNAARNPYFNMVEKNSNGYFSLVKTNSDGSALTRQTAPNVYDLNASFYWYRRNFFDSNFQTAITDKSLIYLMDHTCFDLDHPIDFLFMEYLLVNNKLDFEL